jgi:hypothetical protein
MRLQYGFVGAVLGAIVGGAATVLIVSAATVADTFGEAFGIITFGPVGLLVGTLLGIVLSLRVLRYVHSSEEEHEEKRKTLLVRSLLIGAPVAAFLMIWWSISLGGPPSDAQMLNNFREHRSIFERLAQMVEQDKGVTKIDDVSMGAINVIAPGVSPARIATYQRLMKSVGIRRGFEATPDGSEVDFMYYAVGAAFSSDTNKGYVYLTKPPKRLAQSLDNCETNDGEDDEEAYQHITGKWYLFYQYLPGYRRGKKPRQNRRTV